MSNANKNKGDAFERAARDHAIAHGVPAARTKAGYERDGGDLHFYPSPAHPPTAIGQCKATPKVNDLVSVLRATEQQRIEARATWGAAIIKRIGTTDPGEQYVAMTYNTFLSMLAAASSAATPTERSA